MTALHDGAPALLDAHMNDLELWGGIECTVNRVGDGYHRQLEFSAHDRRPEDLAAIAQLGIKKLRYPVLWEDVAPNGVDAADWRWPDERLPLLRELHIEPIVGFLHHGSGPTYTSLVADNFVDALAEYAVAVARRYPWISCYTPINEPLTTARFSTLYGLWYPHERSDRQFVKAILNQCRATVLAMRAVRRENPAAQLIQTDDLGKIHSTPKLAYQAEFENHRRWLSWDLLCGKINKTHPMRKYLLRAGATSSELDWFTYNACPPDIVGVNHYVTSDRYLHQEEAWSPRDCWGGNSRERYADTEAVRVLQEPALDIIALLHEVWNRYHLPVAITEAHLGCTREEQLRWLNEVWNAARTAREQGADVRAVTAWALLGSFDWNSLLTTFTGHYEPGAFDVRSATPRETAIGKLIKSLSSSQSAHVRGVTTTPTSDTKSESDLRCDDSVGADTDTINLLLATPGWWRRNSRLLPGCHIDPSINTARATTRPLLITGATGTLGQAFARICKRRGLEYRLCSRNELDIGERKSIQRALHEINPWAVINAAGYVRVDEAEQDRERCYRENVRGPTELAAACADNKLRLLTFSSDLVFDGETNDPYLESNPARPLNVYGMSKARAEISVLLTHPRALVIRTSAFFGPWDEHNFLTLMLRTLQQGGSFTAIDDVFVSPTYVPDLVNISLDLLIDGEFGLWHLANRGVVSWAELARQTAHVARVSIDKLTATGWQTLGLAAQRPRYTALSSERALLMPHLESAIERYVAGM